MTTYIQGIDISNHQGTVDHQQVAESGMKFCICKATEGCDYEDDEFATNIEGIRAVLEAGYEYYPGAYHFARPDTYGGTVDDARNEANDFCDVIERRCGSILQDFMPPVLDFEKYSDSDGTENVPWIEAWIEVVQERLGREPMIYTGANVWLYETGNSDAFVGYPLWQVYYSGTATQPAQTPWPSWSLWQYSGGGSYQHYPDVPGIPDGVVDVDRWHGTLDELREFVRARRWYGRRPAPQQQTWPTPPATIDLNAFRGTCSEYVARVQGLLLSHGYGPDGLLDGSGRPDGLMGSKTERYLEDFKAKHGLLADTTMDWATWWALCYDKLSA